MSFEEVEEARQKFMRGEISAADYWETRMHYYSQFITPDN